ncbi:hypothetical protein V8J82_09955 [Gymnodinialimonas sp. 2305UL16-5]|uniref:hypothetical protein n=1 Tax=Gymnodinialimonas mytili TaxID=3126503 RepID=UPI00309DA599
MSGAVDDLAKGLAEDGALKLWSVLVTCLGDVSQKENVEVSGLVLSTLVERIGLQPQAMRVALHRLKRDGWITSRRDGRVGFHCLSDVGLAQTRAVTMRVYGPPLEAGPSHLVGLPPDTPDALSVLPAGMAAVPISRSFALVTGPIDNLPDDWMVATPAPRPFPGWVQDVLKEAACEVEFAALSERLAGVALPDTPLDRFAMRVLVLHAWRRLILRSNPAAEMALGQARAEVACRAQVLAVLRDLGPLRTDRAFATNQSVLP